MTDHDKAAARREIADALLAALDRRHELLDAIVDADSRPAAVTAVSQLLGASQRAGEAVIGMSFEQLTRESRRKIQAELDDLNSRLAFTLNERPASSGDTLELRPFSSITDRDIFAARTADVGAAGDGSGGPAGDLDNEIGSAQGRVNAEEAAWFVVLGGDEKVGMVFGELLMGEVNVRVWIHPEKRRRGYGTAALRKSRSEMASYFPAVPMVVRAPGTTS